MGRWQRRAAGPATHDAHPCRSSRTSCAAGEPCSSALGLHACRMPSRTAAMAGARAGGRCGAGARLEAARLVEKVVPARRLHVHAPRKLQGHQAPLLRRVPRVWLLFHRNSRLQPRHILRLVLGTAPATPPYQTEPVRIPQVMRKVRQRAPLPRTRTAEHAGARTWSFGSRLSPCSLRCRCTHSPRTTLSNTCASPAWVTL